MREPRLIPFRNRNTQTWFAAAIAGLLFVFIVIPYAAHMWQAHRRVVVTQRASLITMQLYGYVSDHGEFPPSLETLVAKLGLDHRLIEPVFDERIEYAQPTTTAPSNTPVLTVTLGKTKITVNKALERRTEILTDSR